MSRKLLVGGACILTLVAMGACTGAASAASWVILNSGGKALESLKASLQGEAAKPRMSLLTRFLSVAIEFRCSSGQLINASLEAEGKISNGFQALFTGCVTYLNGTATPECTPRTVEDGLGTIITNKLKGSLVTSETLGPIKVEPKEGTTLASLDLSASCAFLEKTTISGVLYLQDNESLLPQHQVKHLVEEALGTELWIGSKTAEHLQTQIDGGGFLFLAAEHSGLKWGAPETHRPSWLVLNESGEALKKLKAGLQIKNTETTVALLTKILGIKVQIRCSGSELTGGTLEVEGKTTGLKSKFTGCGLLNTESGKAIEGCVPRTKGMSAGTVESSELKAEISGESVKVSAVAGTLAQLEWGSECLLASPISVSGTLFLKDVEGKFKEHLVTHSAIQASGTKLWVGNESAEHLETSIDGGVSVFLTSTHVGLKWSGMP